MRYTSLIAFFTSLIGAALANPLLLGMLKDSGTTSLNYKKEEIPIAMGLLFVLVQSISLGILAIFMDSNFEFIFLYLFAISLMGLIGLLDDLTGDIGIKGFKGHVKAFFRGKLTSGGIKAGMGFLISLFVAIFISDNFIGIIINSLSIALFTNLINLFDLRPGRASKVFILISLLMLFTGRNQGYGFLLSSFYGILFVYLPLDLKAQAMMGDIGSNVLGMTLGIYCGLGHGRIGQAIYLIGLLLIHILAEKVSFSEIIARNKFLNYIDQLGR